MKQLFVTLSLAATLGVPAAGRADELPAGTFKLPGTGTVLKFSGFIQLDGTYDLNGRTTDINGLDWASFLPVQPFDNTTPQRQFYVTARTSRFGVTTTTPTGIGDVGARLEADFNSPSPNGYSTQLTTNGVTFRLRQAYATFGNFLVGQSWSTYMDLMSLPDTVETRRR